MTAPLPSSQQPIGVLREGGRVFADQVWMRWFNSFTQSPSPITAITPGASPFSITTLFAGNYFISGGAVNSISLQRGTTTINTGMTSGFIPAGGSDVIVVDYSVAPSIQFIPS